MTAVYVDTEFNGFGGGLISMALVTDDGREWYEALPLPTKLDPWVAENVVPVIGKAAISSDEFRASLHAFLRQVSEPVVIADWYTDLVHFFACMAGRDHFGSLTYPCEAQLIDLDSYVSAVPHNALEDARAIRAALSRGASA